MKKIIKYIEGKLINSGNISIHLGTLSEKDLTTLRKKFKVQKEIFGYWKFEPLEIKPVKKKKSTKS